MAVDANVVERIGDEISRFLLNKYKHGRADWTPQEMAEWLAAANLLNPTPQPQPSASAVVEAELSWKTTALAMRDAAIYMARDFGATGSPHMRAIEEMYLNAALLDKYTAVYHISDGTEAEQVRQDRHDWLQP